MKKNILSLLLGSIIICAVTPAAFGFGNPTSVKLKIYRVLFSADPLCSSPFVAYTSSSYMDFMTLPTMGSGVIPAGTYPCMIWEMSDQVKVTPATTSGSCTAGVEIQLDICKAGQNSVGADGSVTQCGTGTDDRMTVYFSTASLATTAGSSNPLTPPTSTGDSVRGMNLNGALVVSGDTSGTLIFNANNTIDGSGASCDMQPPLFGFRNG